LNNVNTNKEFKDEDLRKTTTHGKNFDTFRSAYHKKGLGVNSHFNQSTTTFSNFNNSINGSSNSTTTQAKEVDVQVKKINLNRHANEKYNKIEENSSLESLLLPALPEKLLKKIELQNSPLNQRRNSMCEIRKKMDVDLYPIVDILKEETMKKMIVDYKEKIRMKNKLSFVNETQFRTTYQQKTIEEKLMETLKDTVVASNNTNIIQYLGEKEEISKFLVDKLHETDSQSQMRLNRVCQRVYVNNSLYELRKVIMNKKVQAKHNEEVVSYFDCIDEMKDELANRENILKKYAVVREFNKQEIFEDRIKEINKHWSKLNVQRFYHNEKKKCAGTAYNKFLNNNQEAPSTIRMLSPEKSDKKSLFNNFMSFKDKRSKSNLQNELNNNLEQIEIKG